MLGRIKCPPRLKDDLREKQDNVDGQLDFHMYPKNDGHYPYLPEGGCRI